MLWSQHLYPALAARPHAQHRAIAPGLLPLCPEPCRSLESFEGLWLCLWEVAGPSAGPCSVLGFLEHICKEPCHCFQPVPWAVVARCLGRGSRPALPFPFSAGGGFPPWLEAMGRGQLLELRKSCFPVMGCTPGAVTNYPAALAPSLQLLFSFIPLLPPCFSCSCRPLSQLPFLVPFWPAFVSAMNSRETARAEACLLQQEL